MYGYKYKCAYIHNHIASEESCEWVIIFVCKWARAHEHIITFARMKFQSPYIMFYRHTYSYKQVERASKN